MPITHNKSNTIPDFTGVVTVFGSNGSTETVNATDLVRPSDWNSVHNIVYNLSGNTLGSSQVSGGDIVLYGGNNITLSADTLNSQLLIQAAGAGAGGSINFSAGTTSNNLATVVFSNSNGVSFGLNGSTITGSHNGLTAQSIQTQNMVSVLGSTGDISFANSNGVTFGGNASTITASHNGLTSQSNQALSGSNGSFTFQTATFGNLNGASFYTSNGSLVASYTVPSVAGLLSNVNISAGTTSNNLSAITFDNSNGVSFGLNGSVITATVATNYLTSQSNQALSGSNGSFAFQTATFGNLNGMSFYTSNGSLVGSYTVPSTAGLISNINVSAGTTSNNLSAVTFSNANNVTFGLNGSVVTASVAPPGAASINVSAGTTSNNLTALTFSDSNGVSFGLNGSVVTATVKTDYLTSQSNQAASAANGSFAFQTISFSNLNGISFGTSAGSAITASHNGLTSQSNQAFSAQGGSSAFQTLSFNNANGLTFNNNGGAVEASYTCPVVSNAIASVGSATNSGTNTSRFAADDHVHAGVFSVGVSNVGNTSGDTRVDVGRFVFAGGNNITLSQGTAANALNTITISAAAQTNQTIGLYASSNTTGAASSTTQDARSLTFRGIGVASVGMSAGEVLISVPSGGGGLTNINLSAGTTSNNASNFTFANSNGVSFGLNAGTITATVKTDYLTNINVSAGTTSNNLSAITFSNSNSISFGLNGSVVTASYGAVTLSEYFKPLFNIFPANQAGNNSSVCIVPFILENYVALSDVVLGHSRALTSGGNTSSAYFNMSASAVLYTRNGSTLSSFNSGSTQYITTYRSDQSSSMQSGRAIVIPFDSSSVLTPGRYWMAVHVSTNNAATNASTATTALGATISMILNFSHASERIQFFNFGGATNSSNNWWTGMGIISTNSTVDTIAISAISQSGSRANGANLMFVLRNESIYGW